TGKESPNELERIIKQAGRVNTITVGTAMLAKGIDINTGDHPRGLFVIQTYPDTERMTTQIAGRAARNGKPGEWLPIYQINKSQNLIDRFFHYFFPWKRQSINEHSVESLKSKIKLQATIDRLYTQAIDEAQQILMQQIEAWENMLLELFPTDPKIQFELYQWRENLLGELTRSQETNISEATLSASINQFKNLACKLWESAREETWISKAHKASQISTEQHLRLKYLKQLDLAEELNIQMPLLQKKRQFMSGTETLMRQNIETIIMDKAGAVLDYTKPAGALKNNLTQAQSKQLLPFLIGEFCGVSPDAINTFLPKNSRYNSAFLPEVLSNIVNKLIEQKNRILHYEEQQQITESIIQYYQKELMDADNNKIHDLLSKIKPLIFACCKDMSKSSLVNQFKMQGLILTFCTLYQNLNLTEDVNLNKLKSSYNENIMKKLAKHLLEEFDWIKEKPEPLHAFFERSLAKEAASAIYELAQDLINTPQDKDKVQALYRGLQEHKAILTDKYLFSISHSSPRKVINDALNAIDSLNIAPNCDLDKLIH
ncbi:MAG: hypothetical protein HYX60_06130, partial [Legionella longbeachae]|nr:hypothetical protein [Legionella longbeachae]